MAVNYTDFRNARIDIIETINTLPLGNGALWPLIIEQLNFKQQFRKFTENSGTCLLSFTLRKVPNPIERDIKKERQATIMYKYVQDYLSFIIA